MKDEEQKRIKIETWKNLDGIEAVYGRILVAAKWNCFVANRVVCGYFKIGAYIELERVSHDSYKLGLQYRHN